MVMTSVLHVCMHSMALHLFMPARGSLHDIPTAGGEPVMKSSCARTKPSSGFL
jgi:hypothetical protein